MGKAKLKMRAAQRWVGFDKPAASTAPAPKPIGVEKLPTMAWLASPKLQVLPETEKPQADLAVDQRKTSPSATPSWDAAEANQPMLKPDSNDGGDGDGESDADDASATGEGPRKMSVKETVDSNRPKSNSRSKRGDNGADGDKDGDTAAGDENRNAGGNREGDDGEDGSGSFHDNANEINDDGDNDNGDRSATDRVSDGNESADVEFAGTRFDASDDDDHEVDKQNDIEHNCPDRDNDAGSNGNDAADDEYVFCFPTVMLQRTGHNPVDMMAASLRDDPASDALLRHGRSVSANPMNPVVYLDLPDGSVKMHGEVLPCHSVHVVALSLDNKGTNAAPMVRRNGAFKGIVTFPRVDWIGSLEDNPMEKAQPWPSHIAVISSAKTQKTDAAKPNPTPVNVRPSLPVGARRSSTTAKPKPKAVTLEMASSPVTLNKTRSRRNKATTLRSLANASYRPTSSDDDDDEEFTGFSVVGSVGGSKWTARSRRARHSTSRGDKIGATASSKSETDLAIGGPFVESDSEPTSTLIPMRTPTKTKKRKRHKFGTSNSDEDPDWTGDAVSKGKSDGLGRSDNVSSASSSRMLSSSNRTSAKAMSTSQGSKRSRRSGRRRTLFQQERDDNVIIIDDSNDDDNEKEEDDGNQRSKHAGSDSDSSARSTDYGNLESESAPPPPKRTWRRRRQAKKKEEDNDEDDFAPVTPRGHTKEKRRRIENDSDEEEGGDAIDALTVSRRRVKARRRRAADQSDEEEPNDDSDEDYDDDALVDDVLNTPSRAKGRRKA